MKSSSDEPVVPPAASTPGTGRRSDDGLVLAQDLVDVTPQAYSRALKRARDGETYRLLGRAVAGGAVGDRLLVAVHPLVGRDLRVLVTAALGDAAGAGGYATLHAAASETGPGTSDLRTVAVMAMVRRAGTAATADLVRAWAARDWGTRTTALMGLAAVGDDRVRDEVWSWLRRRLKGTRRQAMGMPTDVVCGLVYLLRHLRDDDGPTLTALLRGRWSALDEEEREWLVEQWPGVAPGGPAEPAPPDGAVLGRWLADGSTFSSMDWSGEWADRARDYATSTVELDDEEGSVVEVTYSVADGPEALALAEGLREASSRRHDVEPS